MRKAANTAIIIFGAAVIFFSLFGDMIYSAVTPDVSAYTVSAAVMTDGGLKLVLPKECVRDGRVMIIESYPAFERTVYTARSVEVLLREGDSESGKYLIESGLKQGDRVVLTSEKELREGDRVETDGHG